MHAAIRSALKLIAALIFLSVYAPNSFAQSTGKAFTDCRDCPQMVVIPSGSFMMGSPANEANRVATEGPQHRVTFKKEFALAAFPVTRDDFARFVAASKHPTPEACKALGKNGWQDQPGVNWRNPSYPQSGTDPVACVSYDDALAYAAWLSAKTGKKYRLPSEAEWEYAARAGGSTAYPWGTEASHEFANYGTDECCEGLTSGRDRWVYSSPVGSFPPNAFGVYDMVGNMFQWVADCWNENFDKAPTDGSAWMTGQCDERAQRGTSWHASAAYLRIAYRVHFAHADRNIYLGFRIARDL